ncbi:control of ATPase protein 2 [Metschnikowia aff. pulcherrima]|uniref:Control of ATPase protein 2 n=1 Tax=Metschnikowia aff. pulcherrima TaxID=2163413 RepID=A0A4P6XDY6_9ASCO|nr:control of ATPase protein 2 [Metschnikowia aff. pulcherrima]
MDFVRPGLPKNVLHQARSTNTILFRLLDQIQQLHDKTNEFLAILGTDPKTAENSGTSESVAEIFTEFYYSLKINTDGKLSAVPEISIASLQRFQSRISDSAVSTDFERGLVLLMDEYCTILGLHHLANSILYKTIVAKSHLAYWANVKLSSLNKAIYGIQTIPERTYRTLWAGFSNAVSITEDREDKGRVSRVLDPVFASFKNLFESAWLKLNVNFIVRQSRLLFLKIPIRFLDKEIKTKMSALNAQLDEHYKMLGIFLNSLPVSTTTLAHIFPEFTDNSVVSQLAYIDQFIREESKASLTAPPSFLVRYWPLLLLSVNYGPSASLNVWQNRAEIASWVKLNFFDTILGFWRNWVVKPIGDMLSILRNDEAMTITLKESLKSDLDSLERMVTDYLTDTNVKINPAEISAAVKQGDLTMVMSQYEDELRTPYKSILTGLLIRSILIQVQKTKVDGDLAISGIDKLLKLQQLLFGVLSILPSLFILYQANRALRKDASLSQNVISRRIDCLKCMNQINRLINREIAEDKYVSDGKLFVEVVNLSLLSQQIVPKSLRSEFVQDLNQLALASSDTEKDARVAVGRVWNMYSPFFRK